MGSMKRKGTSLKTLNALNSSSSHFLFVSLEGMNSTTLGELVQEAEDLNVISYYLVVPIVMLYYDWILTLPKEIKQFWKLPITLPAFLFFVNRYLPITGLVVVTLAYFTDIFSPEICANRILPFMISLNVINQSLIGVIAFIRTWAICRSTRKTYLALAAIALAGEIALGIWAVLKFSPRTGTSRCLPELPEDLQSHMIYVYIALVVYDSLVFFITLREARRVRKIRVKCKLPQESLVEVVIRSGTLYFLSLLISSIASILIVKFSKPNFHLMNISMNHLFPVIMTSRLCLNLREDIQRGHDEAADTTSSSIHEKHKQEPPSLFLSTVLQDVGIACWMPYNENQPYLPRYRTS